jgi:hypothetical protein
MDTPEGKNHKNDAVDMASPDLSRSSYGSDGPDDKMDVCENAHEWDVLKPVGGTAEGVPQVEKMKDVIHIVEDEDETAPMIPKIGSLKRNVKVGTLGQTLKMYSKKPKLLTPKLSQEEELEHKRKTCHVMILDSLGIQRAQCIKNLKEFLRMEALNRKGIQVSTQNIKGIHAKAPIQPNHCDCGVYVLNFVETFFKDADRFTNYILVMLFNVDP